MAIKYEGKFNPIRKMLKQLALAVVIDSEKGNLSKKILDDAPFNYAFSDPNENPISFPSIAPASISLLQSCPSLNVTFTTYTDENRPKSLPQDTGGTFIRGLVEADLIHTSQSGEVKEIDFIELHLKHRADQKADPALKENLLSDEKAKFFLDLKPNASLQFQLRVYVNEKAVDKYGNFYAELIQILLHEVMAHAMPVCRFVHAWFSPNNSKTLRSALDDVPPLWVQHCSLITNGPVNNHENQIIYDYLDAVEAFYYCCEEAFPQDDGNMINNIDKIWKAFCRAQFTDLNELISNYSDKEKTGLLWWTPFSKDLVHAYNRANESIEQEASET